MLKKKHASRLTDNHCGELEALPDALPVHLVWKVGETDVAHELFADDGRDTVLGRRLLEGGGGAIWPVRGERRVAVGRAVVGHGSGRESKGRGGRKRERMTGRGGGWGGLRYLDGREEWNGGKN